MIFLVRPLLTLYFAVREILRGIKGKIVSFSLSSPFHSLSLSLSLSLSMPLPLTLSLSLTPLSLISLSHLLSISLLSLSLLSFFLSCFKLNLRSYGQLFVLVLYLKPVLNECRIHIIQYKAQNSTPHTT